MSVVLNVAKMQYIKANTVDLGIVLNHFGIDARAGVNISCPFHTDKSPSFRFYNDTNSFYCFSCHSSGGPVRFVELFCGVDGVGAIGKIASLGIDSTVELSPCNFDDFKVCFEFSHAIRAFLTANKDNPRAIGYAEYVTKAFDNIRGRYELGSPGLSSIVVKLRTKLSDFT